MIIEPDFPDHWKTQMLIQLSEDPSSPLWVIRLWAHCQQRKTHEFTNLSPEALKAVCRFVGQASKLESLLRTCGFIRRCDEKLIVHQWNEYNASLLANWDNGKLGGRPKSEPKKKPIDNPPETHGLAMGNPSITHQEPIDKIDKIDKKEIILQFVERWNSTTLPKCLEITRKRITSISQRLENPFFKDNWEQALEKIKVSSFCNGQNDRKWKATIDWFIRPDTVTKIMEGAFDNRSENKPVYNSI